MSAFPLQKLSSILCAVLPLKRKLALMMTFNVCGFHLQKNTSWRTPKTTHSLAVETSRYPVRTTGKSLMTRWRPCESWVSARMRSPPSGKSSVEASSSVTWNSNKNGTPNKPFYPTTQWPKRLLTCSASTSMR